MSENEIASSSSTSKPSPESPTHVNEIQWRQILAEIDRLINEEGLSQSKALKAVRTPEGKIGVSRSAFHKWRQIINRIDRGDAAAVPRMGRPAMHEFTNAEKQSLQWYRLKHESLPTAARKFVENSKVCRPETRAFFEVIFDKAATTRRSINFPMCVRRAAEVSDEVRALFRGGKAYQDLEMTVNRGLFWIDADGNKQPLRANDIWESDDMSVNEPFRFQDADTGQERLGRQVLFTQDVYSKQFLSELIVCRERDAYRAEDILDHILSTIDEFGMPLVWRIERGVWESTAIDGVPLDSARARQLGFRGEQYQGKTIGGLGDIMNIVHCHSSKGKGGLEGSFNLLQALSAHASLSIGRHRGEFELATKHYLRANNQNATAETRGKSLHKFWTETQCANQMAGFMDEFNQTPKHRAAFGADHVVPIELYRDAPRRELLAEERWRFSPVKRIAVVQRGMLTWTESQYYNRTFQFAVNGVDGLFLDHGHRVVMAFHPGKPELGCHLINVEFGPRNRNHWGIGEYIGLAQHVEQAPQVVLDANSRSGRAGEKRKSSATARTEFRATKQAGQEEEAARKSTLRTGDGREASISNREDHEQPTESPLTSPKRNTQPKGGVRSTTPVVTDDELAALEDEF